MDVGDIVYDCAGYDSSLPGIPLKLSVSRCTDLTIEDIGQCLRGELRISPWLEWLYVVLYSPMKDLMCLTFVIYSSFVLIKELFLCGDRDRNPPCCHIQPAMLTDFRNMIVLLGSTFMLAKDIFSKIHM